MVTYVPGDVISLKAGDTFTGWLSVLGSGLLDTSTFNSTFNSTETTNQAAYAAGATYSDCHARAIADGASSGLADTIATGKCRLLANRDALQAAFPAADASANTKWITITSYGAGANPIIDATGTNAAIEFQRTGTGGWKVKNLEIKNAKAAGIHCDTNAANGLWVENCNIHDIDGMPLPPGGSDNASRVAGFTNAWAAGVEALNVNCVNIKGCTINNTGTPAMIWQNQNTLVDSTTCDTSKYQSFWFVGTSVSVPSRTVCIINSRITNMGTLGWPNGSADVAMTDVDTCILDTCQIDTAAHADSDAEAVDFEAGITRFLAIGCNFHDCYGATFAQTFGNTDALIFSGNTFTNNGTGDPTKKPALIRSTPATTYHFWELNTITRAGVGTTQKLFASQDYPPTYFSDTPQTNIFYGTDNTVTP